MIDPHMLAAARMQAEEQEIESGRQLEASYYNSPLGSQSGLEPFLQSVVSRAGRARGIDADADSDASRQRRLLGLQRIKNLMNPDQYPDGFLDDGRLGALQGAFDSELEPFHGMGPQPAWMKNMGGAFDAWESQQRGLP